MLAVTAGTCLAAARPIEAITRPSANVVLKFTRPGLVAKVLVTDGEAVKVGQVVAQLDDDAEKMQVAQLKAQAEDPTRVDASKAQLAQKRLDLRKYQDAMAAGRAVTKMEVEHAKLDVTIAELSLKLAEFQQLQDKRKYEEARVRLDRMRMISPIDGTIEGLIVEQGESVDALEEVLRIVKINPLWINVAVPMSQARLLKKGDPATVTFPPAGAGTGQVAGKIIHMPSEADSASDTLKIRVEVPNPTARRAGERVSVSFTRAKAAAGVSGQSGISPPVNTRGASARTRTRHETENPRVYSPGAKGAETRIRRQFIARVARDGGK